MKLPAFFKTKFFSFLSWLLVIVLIFLFSFFLWRRFYPSIPQISSTVQAVELPSGIKPKDLGNLSLQQQQQLDQAISLSIEKQLATNPFLKENQPAIIVLTHNNQPILPDLNSNQSLSSPAVPTTASRDLSTPTVKPSSTSIPTPIPATSTPTNIPCADTDGGKDYFTKGTLTTSYGDTYTDFCSDPTIISEYYCPVGASFASDGYICPGLCLDGACLSIPSLTAMPTTAKPTKRPSLTSTPTITPTPTNVPCTDSDGGKDIYTKGSVITWGQTHFDTCYSLQGVGDLDQCSGYFCRLLEFSCQPQGFYGDGFTCQYGCLDGACIKTPSPTPTSTPTLTPTPTLTSTPTLIPTSIPPTNTLTPTPTLSPYQYELNFVYVGDIEAKYNTATGNNLADDIQQIYQEVRLVFGPPRAPITVTVKYGPSDHGRFSSYYNATTNEMVLGDYDFHQLEMIQKVILAFHDDITYFMPFNWELPLWNLTTSHVRAKLNPSYNGLTACTFCQLYGDSPAWATLYGDSWNPISAATFSSLASDTLGKPLIEDPQFFVKFNQAIYQLPADGGLKTKLPATAASVKATVEGILFNDWYSSQYILHFNPVPGKYIIPFLDTSSDPLGVTLAIKLVEVKSDGNKIDVGNKTITITGFDQSGTQFWSHQATADSQGVANLGTLPGYACPVASFHIYVPDFTSRDFSYPYYNSNPIIPEIETQPGSNIYPGIFGAINRYSGQFKYVHGQTSYQSDGVDGNFIYWGGIDNGIFSITYMADDNDPGITKSISKFNGPYYVNFQLPAITSSSRSSATRGGSSETDFVCDTEDWHNYYSDNFEFEVQYPPGWDTQSAYTSDKIYQTRLSLVSTTDSASLLDHTAQYSFFDIIASQTDLKTDENYSRWFDDNTGNQTISQTQILGQSAEQFLNETDMPGGQHRNLMYYLKHDGNYYLVSLAYYITPDIKTANEQLVDCFLNTIKLIQPEPTPAGGIYKCSQGMYLTFEEKKQYPYSLPPGRCDNWDDKREVCGYYRMVFDNNEMKDSHQQYPDACQFCADFDQSGQKGLRGTTFYNLGYTIGPCPN